MSSAVSKANLLSLLPFADSTVDLLYTSHFVEHIPRTLIISFLKESFRVTKSSSYVRLVLPDLEELCKTYLAEREKGEHGKADFLMLEMLDQCVRTTRGGELGAFFNQLRLNPEKHASMIEYVKIRTGDEIQVGVPISFKKKLTLLLANPARIFVEIERLYCQAIIALLPTAFRKQNVSLASVGERHTWVYDFYSIDKLLKQAGFINVQRVTANTSNIPDFPFYPLDVHMDGSPRKGLESMYIEAMKP
jgi:hypothetical protein